MLIFLFLFTVHVLYYLLTAIPHTDCMTELHLSTGFLLNNDAYLQPNTLRFEILFTGFGIGHKLWIRNGGNAAHHWSVLYHHCSTAVSSGGWALFACPPCWCKADPLSLYITAPSQCGELSLGG